LTRTTTTTTTATLSGRVSGGVPPALVEGESGGQQACERGPAQSP
jgi:hypothetical protein